MLCFKTAILPLLACFSLFTHSAAPETATPETIIFGIAPWDSAKNLTHKHQPLMFYLTEQLKVKTAFVITRDYADLERQLNSGTIHIGFMPAVSYALARQSMPGLTILAGNSDKHPATGEYRNHYRGVIVTMKSSGITSLKGLKKKRFGFTDIDSSSGYQYPLQLMHDEGISPESFFSQTFMLKKHPKVTQTLINGAIDGGATTDDELYRATQKYGDIFTTIGLTENIPFDAVTVAPHINSALFEKNDAFYDSVRRVRDTMKRAPQP
jgi:phosphonate transport system substrate-binding protein